MSSKIWWSAGALCFFAVGGQAQSGGAADASAPEAAVTPRSGVVEVTYSPPKGGRYFDAGDTRLDEERTEKTLAKHLQQLGARWLPPGGTLKLNITEIDLAGRIPPTAINRVRVLGGGADWPRIELSYELVDADGRTQRGDEAVSDMNYTMTRPTPYWNETLAYEKRMLDDWFYQRFARRSL